MSPILGIVASQNYPRSISVQYLVIAGGGSGSTSYGGGGGAGGYLTSAAYDVIPGVAYNIQIGAVVRLGQTRH